MRNLAGDPQYREVVALREEVSNLQKEKGEVKRSLSVQIVWPEKWMLSAGQSKILSCLYTANGAVRSRDILQRLLGAAPGSKSIYVMMRYLRMRLPPEITISIAHGRGYYLLPKSIRLLREALVHESTDPTRPVITDEDVEALMAISRRLMKRGPNMATMLLTVAVGIIKNELD